MCLVPKTQIDNTKVTVQLNNILTERNTFLFST